MKVMTLIGSAYGDYISDDLGDDIVYGLGGDDTFKQGSGGDTFDGGDGTDTLKSNWSSSLPDWWTDSHYGVTNLQEGFGNVLGRTSELMMFTSL